MDGWRPALSDDYGSQNGGGGRPFNDGDDSTLNEDDEGIYFQRFCKNVFTND
jgi:hypothetical protein